MARVIETSTRRTVHAQNDITLAAGRVSATPAFARFALVVLVIDQFSLQLARFWQLSYLSSPQIQIAAHAQVVRQLGYLGSRQAQIAAYAQVVRQLCCLGVPQV